MYCIRPLLYVIINVTLRYNQFLYEVYWLQYKLYWYSYAVIRWAPIHMVESIKH